MPIVSNSQRTKRTPRLGNGVPSLWRDSSLRQRCWQRKMAGTLTQRTKKEKNVLSDGCLREIGRRLISMKARRGLSRSHSLFFQRLEQLVSPYVWTCAEVAKLHDADPRWKNKWNNLIYFFYASEPSYPKSPSQGIFGAASHLRLGQVGNYHYNFYSFRRDGQ